MFNVTTFHYTNSHAVCLDYCSKTPGAITAGLSAEFCSCHDFIPNSDEQVDGALCHTQCPGDLTGEQKCGGGEQVVTVLLLEH